MHNLVSLYTLVLSDVSCQTAVLKKKKKRKEVKTKEVKHIKDIYFN